MNMMNNCNNISLYSILFESLPKGFSFEKLEELSYQNPEYAQEYAAKFFKLDKSFKKGSSRAVFILDSKRVLKVAKNEAGVAQNKEEYKNFRNYPLIGAKIYKSGQGNSYLVSELVRGVQDTRELTNYFGFDILYAVSSTPEHSLYKLKQIPTNKQPEQVSQLVDAINNGLAVGDIYYEDHWEKTASGRYVLLDYGASEEIISTYY